MLHITPKNTLIITAILLFVVPFMGLGTALAGIEVLNQDLHDKTVVYRVGDEAAHLVKIISFYINSSVILIVAVLAAFNLKFKNKKVNNFILMSSIYLILWMFFATWALDRKYVPRSESIPWSNSSPNDVNESPGFRIQTMDIN